MSGIHELTSVRQPSRDQPGDLLNFPAYAVSLSKEVWILFSEWEFGLEIGEGRHSPYPSMRFGHYPQNFYIRFKVEVCEFWQAEGSHLSFCNKPIKYVGYVGVITA